MRILENGDAQAEKKKRALEDHRAATEGERRTKTERARKVAPVLSGSVRRRGLWPARLLCPWGSPGRGFPGGSLVRICLPGQEAWVGARISGRSACLGATTPGGRDPRACAPGPGAATGEPTRPRARPARGKPLGEGPPPRPESNFARRNQRKPAPRQDDTQPKINKQLFF